MSLNSCYLYSYSDVNVNVNVNVNVSICIAHHRRKLWVRWYRVNNFLQAPESSFSGVRIADRVRKTVPDGRTSNGKSPAAVRVESVKWYVQ